MGLMTLAEFQTKTDKQHTNVYSVKMTKIKLKKILRPNTICFQMREKRYLIT